MRKPYCEIRISIKVEHPTLVRVKAHRRRINGKPVKVKAHYRRLKGI